MPIYNYTNTISTLHDGQRHAETKLGLAFSDLISGMIPIGMREEGIWNRGT